MTDLERLRVAMIAFPEEEAPRRMYVDELMEVAGCSQDAAEQIARGYWWPARSAQRIGRAVALIIGTSSTARRLQWLAHRQVCQPIPISARVFVTSGLLFPTTAVDDFVWSRITAAEDEIGVVDSRSGDQLREPPPMPYILVGADWVLATAAAEGFIADPVGMYDPPETAE